MSIRDGVIDIGIDSTRFTPGDDDGLLRSYLVLVRSVRDRRRATTITLRREDIEAIAEYLGATAEAVLGKTADLMGSTRTQRAAMLTLFATGAMLIAVTGSVAAETSRSPATAIGGAPPPTAVVTTVVPEAGGSLAVPTLGPPSVGIDSGVDGNGPERSAPLVESFPTAAIHATDPAEVHAASALEESSPAAGSGLRIEVDQPAPAVSNAGATGVIIGADGEPLPVAVGIPPVPPEQPAALDSREPTQAVGPAPTGQPDQPEAEPWVEPSEAGESGESSESPQVGVTDDGATVAVGLPPVPPATG